MIALRRLPLGTPACLVFVVRDPGPILAHQIAHSLGHGQGDRSLGRFAICRANIDEIRCAIFACTK